MKKIIYLLGFIISGMVASCEREVTIDAATPAQINMTGKWEITAYINSEPIYGPFKVFTTEDPTTLSDSITIQDSDIKFWDFQVKAAIDRNKGTFETELSQCKMSDKNIGIKIPSGKIINTDSIFFEIQFEDDETPYGNTYQLKGHRISE